MRLSILTAVAAMVALLGLAVPAYAGALDRDGSVASVRACRLAEPLGAQGHESRMFDRVASAAIGCEGVVVPPVVERAARSDHPEGWRHEDLNAAGDRDLYADTGRAMRRMWYEPGAAPAANAVHHENENRLGWDDREYAQRDGGAHWDVGEGPGGVHHEAFGRSFEPGEHWLGDCGCRSSSTSATAEDGDVVWPDDARPAAAGPGAATSDLRR